MGLMIPQPPSWSRVTTNLPSTPTATSVGTSVNAAANNTKGTAVQLLSALAHDVEFIKFAFADFNSSGVDGSTLLDILIDPAGGTSWSVLIPNLLVGYTATFSLGGNINTSREYYFPIWIPAGASIGAQAQTAGVAPIAGRAIVYALGANKNPGSWWCGQAVEAIGIDTGTSHAQAHTAGASGSFSSWTNLGSTLSRDAYAFQWGFQGEQDTDAVSGDAQEFQFGIASMALGYPVYGGCSFLERASSIPGMPVFYSAPSGAQLQVRGKSSAATVQPYGVAAWAIS